VVSEEITTNRDNLVIFPVNKTEGDLIIIGADLTTTGVEDLLKVRSTDHFI